MMAKWNITEMSQSCGFLLLPWKQDPCGTKDKHIIHKAFHLSKEANFLHLENKSDTLNLSRKTRWSCYVTDSLESSPTKLSTETHSDILISVGHTHTDLTVVCQSAMTEEETNLAFCTF